jgi:hypothetical protein
METTVRERVANPLGAGAKDRDDEAVPEQIRPDRVWHSWPERRPACLTTE